MSAHTFEELVEDFRGRARTEERNIRDARIRADVWEEAASWVSIVMDRVKDGQDEDRETDEEREARHKRECDCATCRSRRGEE